MTQTEGSTVQSTSSTSTSSSSTMAGNSAAAVGAPMTSRVPMTLRDFFFQDPFFQSSWSDFGKIREDMMRESREFWAKAEADMKAMNESMAANMAISDNSGSGSTVGTSFPSGMGAPATVDGSLMSPMIFPRRWMFPRLMSRNDATSAGGVGTMGPAMDTKDMFPVDFFSNMNFNKDEQIIRMKDDDTKFEISFDTHDYRPDEIKVNVHGGTLSVDAKHEEKSDNKFVSRQFSRKYTLPSGCVPEQVHSNLSSDGILMVTAPKRQELKMDAGSRAIPVEMKK